MGASFPEFVGLGIDLLFFTLFNSWYKRLNKSADEIKKAPTLKLDDDLISKVKATEDGYFAYACVEGEVMPVHQTLFSHHKEGSSGVIQHVLLEEHKSKRVQGFWTDVKNTIKDKIQSVPFKLRSMVDSNAEILVTEPTEASFIMDELFLVHDNFEQSNAGMLARGIDRVFGETVKGYQETERMLLTNTLLLGIGEIALVDDKLHLRPSRNGAKFILTKMSKLEVIKRLESQSYWVRLLTIGTGVIGVGLLAAILYKQYKKWVQQRNQEAFRSEIMQARRSAFAGRQNNAAGEGENDEDSANNSCVVCLNNPREIVLLNCGHICVCVECVLLLPEPLCCPVCRQSVERYVTTYNP